MKLEAKWGDWLVEQKRVDQAINHYIEAGEHEKAIKAALDSAQWAKAAQLVEDTLNGDVAKPYFMRIANHYRDKKRYDLAEKYFVQAGKPNEAVDMYTRANKWEAAHRVAVRFMRYVKLVFVVHVGGTRYVTSSTDNIMKRLARITLTVEFIRTCIFIF